MKWRKQASSTLSSLKSLRKDVMDTLASWNICSEDDQFALEVVILELLSNAVKHGNRWQEEKKVKVNMRYLPAARNLILLVCDGEPVRSWSKRRLVWKKRGGDSW